MVRRKRLRAGGFTTFAAGGIAGTLVGIAAKLIWDGVVDRAASSELVVTIMLILAVITVIAVVIVLSRKVDQLVEKASFSIDYCEADKPAAVYQLCRELVARAGPHVEIYAVNSYVEVFRDSNDPAHEPLQRQYLAEFEREFSSVKYHRLIQVRDGQRGGDDTRLATLLAPAYRDHYLRMASYAKELPGSQITIEEVPAKLPTSFVVLKDRNGNGGRIIWQMNKHGLDADSPEVERIMGVFLITDPDALLVPTFLSWFYELDRGARALTVERLRPSAVEQSG